LRVNYEVTQLITEDERILEKVLLKTMETLKTAVLKKTGTFLVAIKSMEIIEEVTGNSDPCKDFKRRSTQIATKIMPTVIEIINKSSDALLIACKAAIMGNSMDIIADLHAGVSPALHNICNLLHKPLAVNHFEKFKSSLEKAQKVVYLADNAGEVFFDRILIKHILSEKKDISIEYFIKGFPFLNDAQYEDVIPARIEDLATIRVIPLVKPIIIDQEYAKSTYAAFLDAAQKADLIIVKGQANYELLESWLKEAFYLFVHKCPVIARRDSANIGDAVLLKKNIDFTC
jgi:uncharacterized protein with ATP-grasp and redox domains